jgi:hypothetical protein
VTDPSLHLPSRMIVRLDLDLRAPHMVLYTLRDIIRPGTLQCDIPRQSSGTYRCDIPEDLCGTCDSVANTEKQSVPYRAVCKQ